MPNINVPNNPVIADIGISAAVNVLDIISANIEKIAPNKIVKGIVCFVFLPTKNLTICGTINPIQPITPAKATLVAVKNVAIMIVNY
jgi:hypothetical protein